MSRLDELIAELCPGGVDYRPLSDLFIQLRGMSGVKNKWGDTGNCRFIDYMNVYSKIVVDVNDLPFATVSNMNQTILKKGDILFTSASETADECALAAEIEDDIEDGIFLDDHLFALRQKENGGNLFEKGYLKYAFRSSYFRLVVNKVVRGVTRHYIAKSDFMQLLLPVPPKEVQREIVHILDEFTLLTSELSAELSARRKQYEFYRNKLLSFEEMGGQIPKVKLGSICDVIVGGEPPADAIKGNESDEDHIYPIWGNGKEIYGYSAEYKVESDAVCISSIGANTGAVFYHSGKFTPIIRLKVLVPKVENIDNRYLFHAVSTIDFTPKKSSVPNMSAAEIKRA